MVAYATNSADRGYQTLFNQFRDRAAERGAQIYPEPGRCHEGKFRIYLTPDKEPDGFEAYIETQGLESSYDLQERRHDLVLKGTLKGRYISNNHKDSPTPEMRARGQYHGGPCWEYGLGRTNYPKIWQDQLETDLGALLKSFSHGVAAQHLASEPTEKAGPLREQRVGVIFGLMEQQELAQDPVLLARIREALTKGDGMYAATIKPHLERLGIEVPTS
ncbi:MAG: hypothetical protein AABX70_05300 [Nanoarchaeota archaeon]